MKFEKLEVREPEVEKIKKLVENYTKVYSNPKTILKELATSGFYSEEAMFFAEDILEDLMEFQGDRAPLNSDRFFQGVRYYFDTVSKKYSAPSVGLYNYDDPSLLKAKILDVTNRRAEIRGASKKNSAKQKVKKEVRESVLTKDFIENLRTIRREYLDQIAENTVEELKNYFLESEYAFNETEAYEMLESLDKEQFDYFLNEYKQDVIRKKAKSLIFPEIPPSSSAIPYSKTESKGICKGCMKESKKCTCSVTETKKDFHNDTPVQSVDKIANGHNQLKDNNGKLKRVVQQTEAQKLGEACWKDYKQVGMKKKGDKQVPNCVPKSEELEEVEDIEETNLSVGRGEKLSPERGAGLTKKGRDKYNRENGSNLKPPVTSDNPSGEDAARKKSFCARSAGWDGERGRAARARWKC